SPAQMDLNTDLDFGLSTTPAMAAVPTWFAPVQAQLARQEQRLSQVEEIVAENQRLRADLDLAHQRIRELESRLGESQNVDLPAPTPKDFPQLGTSQSKYAPTTSPAALSPNHQVSFADAAHRGQKQHVIPAPVKTPTHRKGLTNRQRQVLVRNFTPMTENQGYQYLYLPNRFRDRISVMRKKLRQLKLDNGRILDVHYPDNKVVALLVHNDYVSEATTILNKCGIQLIQDFNPHDESRLHDPAFAALSKEERSRKMAEVHQNRLFKALEHMRVENRPSVACSFLNLNWITTEQFQARLPVRPTTSNRDISTDLAATNTDSDMADVNDISSALDNLSDSSFPSGDGEPGQNQ
ncbi:unnamed protein product, partial [Rhizopus stolonifer]